jgi:hypothetical protein
LLSRVEGTIVRWFQRSCGFENIDSETLDLVVARSVACGWSARTRVSVRVVRFRLDAQIRCREQDEHGNDSERDDRVENWKRPSERLMLGRSAHTPVKRNRARYDA